MDSSSAFFLTPNSCSISSSASSAGSSSPDLLAHSPASFEGPYDPFEGFSLLDQHQGMRLYDYLGATGRNSPLLNQCPLAAQLDHLDQLHPLPKSHFPFHTDPGAGAAGHHQHHHDDDDELGGFATELANVDSDAGYTSGVDLFSASTLNDCSDSTEAYYLRLALEQNTNLTQNLSSDINNNDNYFEYNSSSFTSSSNSYYGDNGRQLAATVPAAASTAAAATTTTTTTTPATNTKRSVLMNLLIDGSDVGAGYTSHNCRALPQQRNHSALVYHHH